MDAATIEEEALALPLPERAKLVERLLDSLDNLPEQESEALWLDVAERRAREIDQEQVQLVSPEELELRVRAHLQDRQISRHPQNLPARIQVLGHLPRG